MEYVSRGEVVETVIMLHNSKNAREKKDFISVEASSIREYYNHIKRKELKEKKGTSVESISNNHHFYFLHALSFLCQPI